MPIKYNIKSLTIKVLEESEMRAVYDVPVKEFLVQQTDIKSFVGSLAEKAAVHFPWIPRETLSKVQSSLPFITSLFSPGEVVRVFVQLNIEIAGFPIVSRSVFVVKVAK
jgi:hypothetical protein